MILNFGGANQYTLYAANESKLYSKAEFLNLHLKKDENGTITGFALERYGNSQFFSKLK
jgi:hypothetical protein